MKRKIVLQLCQSSVVLCSIRARYVPLYPVIQDCNRTLRLEQKKTQQQHTFGGTITMTSLSHKDDADKKKLKTAKVRAELPYLFEKELTVKQNKRIYIVDEFIATERVAPIEGKFYSKFNDACIKDAPGQCYWNSTENNRDESRMQQGFPVLESQTYGWMPNSVSRVTLKRINCIQAPKRRCAMTVYGEKLSCERVTERSKFTGERFYLR